MFQPTFFHYKLGVLISVLLAGLMDATDGALARLTKRVSKRGAFLDSTIDRISDSTIITSLAPLGYPLHIVITLLVSSFLVSYCRARAESLGLNIQSIGFMERAERLVGLMAILLMSYISVLVSLIALVVLTILTIATFVHRFVFVVSNLNDR